MYLVRCRRVCDLPSSVVTSPLRGSALALGPGQVRGPNLRPPILSVYLSVIVSEAPPTESRLPSRALTPLPQIPVGTETPRPVPVPVLTRRPPPRGPGDAETEYEDYKEDVVALPPPHLFSFFLLLKLWFTGSGPGSWERDFLLIV